MAKDFVSLGISRSIADVLKEDGVASPTEVQAQAIPALLEGKDMIAQAQTGTGKTLAFVLPILEKISPEKPYIQALIVTPTRELALQITQEVKKLSAIVGAKVLAAYGGQDVEAQTRKLKGDIHIVVATPGRLLDHLRRGTLQLSGVNQLVLDEADQMLHMGFLPDVEAIIMETSRQRQTMLFSATMPGPIRILAERYMNKPLDLRIAVNKQVTLDEIEQVVIETTDRAKRDDLCRLIQEKQPYLAIVFCRTKRRCSTLNKALQEQGFASDELHGDLSQAKREQVMKQFKQAKLQILVATDVAARGLDVEGVTHVFNYDIPQDVEGYIHRIGRTGRAGQTGMAITFATSRDRQQLQQIERGIKQSIVRITSDGQRIPGSSGGRRTNSSNKPPRDRNPSPGRSNKPPRDRNSSSGRSNKPPRDRNSSSGRSNKPPRDRNSSPVGGKQQRRSGRTRRS